MIYLLGSIRDASCACLIYTNSNFEMTLKTMWNSGNFVNSKGILFMSNRKFNFFKQSSWFNEIIFIKESNKNVF